MDHSTARKYWTLAMVMVGGNLCQAAAGTWNVTDFGARGDAVQTTANCENGSTSVRLAETNQLSSSDAGKLIELFGAGAPTAGTNHQDLIATIQSVAGGNQVTISVPTACTASNINCTFGTQNAGPFQNCLNACQGSNAVVLVPAGRYLLVPPQVLDNTFAMSSSATLCLAVSISKGGVQFQGDSPDDTILLGNGAWTLKPAFVQRGVLFGCVGPVTNDAPLVFKNLTFDGGVQVGNLGGGSGPASPVDGSGWDITHDAVVDMGEPPYHASQQFINCHLAHWRGEMVKSVVNWDAGFIGVMNCAFQDGDGSGYNFNWTPHVINGCLFSNLNMAMEYYVGTMRTNSVFENSVVTNTRIGIVLCGAVTNHPSPGYNIVSNVISATQYGICLAPARNTVISGNTFMGGLAGVATDGYAYQGSDYNQNILVQNNQFVNAYYAFMNGGAGSDRIENTSWRSNTAVGCHAFASGYGWGSNLVFAANTSLGTQPSQGFLDSSQLAGQWFADDASDRLSLFQNASIATVAPTNTISYAHGRSQQLSADSSRAVFLLDNGQPARIPPGAELMLTNGGNRPVFIFPVSTNWQGNPLVLPAGESQVYQWTNASWLPVPAVGQPSNLRIDHP